MVNAAFGHHKSPEIICSTRESLQTSASDTASISQPSNIVNSNNDAQQKPTSIKLSRTLTEKRKDYVRRVSAVKHTDLSSDTLHQTFKPSVLRTFSVDNTDDTINGNTSASSKYEGNSKRGVNIDRNENIRTDDYRTSKNSDDDIDDVDNCKIISTSDDYADENAPKLFEACLLIGFNNSSRKPYIKSKFGNGYVPPNIEQLVFPSSNLINQTRKNQDYSIILTDNDGNHVYGYCRRILPESCEICLPLAYCLIGQIKAPGFYFKILREIETRHGQAEFQTNFLLQNLQTHSIPAAGKFLHIKLPSSPRPKTITTPHHKVTPKRLSLEVNPKWLTESAAQAVFSNCDTTMVHDAVSMITKKDRSSPKSLLQEFEDKKQQSNNATPPFDLSLINRSLFNGKNIHGKCDEIFIRRPNDLRLESAELRYVR